MSSFRNSLPMAPKNTSTYNEFDQCIALLLRPHCALFHLAVDLLRLSDSALAETSALKGMRRYKDSHSRHGEALAYRRASDLAVQAIVDDVSQMNNPDGGALDEHLDDIKLRVLWAADRRWALWYDRPELQGRGVTLADVKRKRELMR